MLRENSLFSQPIQRRHESRICQLRRDLLDMTHREWLPDRPRPHCPHDPALERTEHLESAVEVLISAHGRSVLEVGSRGDVNTLSDRHTKAR